MNWAQPTGWRYLKEPHAIPDLPITPPIPVVEGTRYIVAMTVHLRASNARIAKKKMKRQMQYIHFGTGEERTPPKVRDMFEEHRRWFRAVCSYEFQAQGTTYQIPIRG